MFLECRYCRRTRKPWETQSFPVRQFYKLQQDEWSANVAPVCLERRLGRDSCPNLSRNCSLAARWPLHISYIGYQQPSLKFKTNKHQPLSWGDEPLCRVSSLHSHLMSCKKMHLSEPIGLSNISNCREGSKIAIVPRDLLLVVAGRGPQDWTSKI